jgi:hypothetical protein
MEHTFPVHDFIIINANVRLKLDDVRSSFGQYIVHSRHFAWTFLQSPNCFDLRSGVSVVEELFRQADIGLKNGYPSAILTCGINSNP